MKYEKNEIIQVKNEEYLILNVIKNRENTYLYLINNNEQKKDISIVKIAKNNEITHIENNEEFELVLNKLFLENKDEILSLIKDEE